MNGTELYEKDGVTINHANSLFSGSRRQPRSQALSPLKYRMTLSFPDFRRSLESGLLAQASSRTVAGNQAYPVLTGIF